jgi:hypothetical protein
MAGPRRAPLCARMRLVMGVTPMVPWWGPARRREDAMAKDPKEASVAVIMSVSPLAIRETSRIGSEMGEA